MKQTKQTKHHDDPPFQQAGPPILEVQLRELRPALDGLAKVVSRKVTRPILGSIKVEGPFAPAPPPAASFVRLTVTDLEVFFSVQIPATFAATGSSQKAAPATFAFLIRFGELQEELRRRRHAHPESTLNLSALVCRGEKVTEFPADPVVPSGLNMWLDERTVRGLLNAFASTSEDETRHVLRGVLVDATEEGKSKLVATDGRHMYVHEAPGLPVLETPFILPDHKFWTWKQLTNPIEPWNLSLDRSKEKSDGCAFQVETSRWSVTGRCIEGNFPTYRQVIPDSSSFTTQVILPPEDLGRIAAAVAQLPGKKLMNRPLALEIDGKLATLLAKDSDRDHDDTASWVRLGIPMVVHRGPNLTVALNRDYLIQALRCGLNRIDMKDADSPLKFSRDGAFMIVMPVRLAAPPAIPRKAVSPKPKRQINRVNEPRPDKPPGALVPAKRMKTEVEVSPAQPSSPSTPIEPETAEPRSNWIIGFTIWLFGGEQEKQTPNLPLKTRAQTKPQPQQHQPIQPTAKSALKPN